jgi:hypothetical protein
VHAINVHLILLKTGGHHSGRIENGYACLQQMQVGADHPADFVQNTMCRKAGLMGVPLRPWR